MPGDREAQGARNAEVCALEDEGEDGCCDGHAKSSNDTGKSDKKTGNRVLDGRAQNGWMTMA